MIREAVILVALSTVLALGINLVSPNAIPYVGEYREIHTGDGPIVPPEASPGDPPFIDINTANMLYTTDQAIWLDARIPEEYVCGTIPGALNISFDYLPASDEEMYAQFDSVLAGVAKDDPIIVFCGGEECEASLHMARLMQDDLGYSNLQVFYGGAREWKRFEFPVERSDECVE